MKRKSVGIIVAVLVLVVVGGTWWSLMVLSQKRLLRAAEDVVFADADSAAMLLERVDTTRLTESLQMLNDLMWALVDVEQRYLEKADTVSCLLMTDSAQWNFSRNSMSEYHKKSDGKERISENRLQHIYNYYEHESLGGTADDLEAIKRFGRICLVMSHHQKEKANIERLLYLTIHCADTCDDHALAYRAYHRLSHHTKDVMQLFCYTRALQHYRRSSDHNCCLLTLLNDYGGSVLLNGPFDLYYFPSLIHISDIIARQNEERTAPNVCDSVYKCLDSLWTLSAPNYAYKWSSIYEDNGTIQKLKISVPVDTYEEAKSEFRNNNNKKYNPDFKTIQQNTIDSFNTSSDSYLAVGYVMKSKYFQRRLMTAVVIILLLTLLLLALLFRSWRVKVKQRSEEERAIQKREIKQLADRLQQKDTTIAMLRGHIMDKSEILDMLEPTAGKRTVIDARNWREIELTLDTVDDNFCSRLRAEYPQFSEEDIRLCMLARLHLSNAALSAIYLISISAIQHRKLKLKKEGFGITDPTMTFDQIIANF